MTDSALVEVDGADTFDATVTFFLCREEELVDANGDPDPDGTCASGGTQIGDPVAVTSSPSTVVSAQAGLTAAERYCWRGEFSGDADTGVPPDTDSSAGECFVVTPITPTLTTSASADVTLGDPIYDTISLTGTATSLEQMASARAARSTRPTAQTPTAPSASPLRDPMTARRSLTAGPSMSAVTTRHTVALEAPPVHTDRNRPIHLCRFVQRR